MDTTALAEKQTIDVAAWVSVQPQFSGIESPLVLDIVTAAFGRLRAVAGEPVAWRYRHQDSNGDWHGWHYRDHAMSQKYPDSEYQPLYTRPQPATPASGWMPIETAPKDGSLVLLGAAWHESVSGRWGWEAPWVDGWWCDGHRSDAEGPKFTPTHWQPLPTPPASKGGE